MINAGVALSSAETLEATCCIPSTLQPLLSTMLPAATMATCRSSPVASLGGPPRHHATMPSSSPARMKRSPAASSGGSSVTITLVARKLEPQTR
jgi:hypothetical protein